MNGPVRPKPALFTSASMVTSWTLSVITSSCAACGLARSAARTRVAMPNSPSSREARCRNFPSLRATRTRSFPSRAKRFASSRPMPLDAPVMRAVFLLLFIAEEYVHQERMMNRFRMAALTALLVLTTGAGATAAKQPLTHETLWLMKRVAAPALSPDGKWVVFSVTDPAYDEKEKARDAWLVPAG